MDWALIESWKEMGVPLHVALRGIERAFDSHEARPRRRSVKSLLYCQEEVEAQYAEWLETQRGGELEAQANGNNANTSDENVGLPFPRAVILTHLAECRASLLRTRDGHCQARENEFCETLTRAALRLEELANDFAHATHPDAEKLEASLTNLEKLIDRAICARLPPDHLAVRRAQAEEQLHPYRKRMERAVYEQTLDNLLAKLLREECGVPRLSLFYL